MAVRRRVLDLRARWTQPPGEPAARPPRRPVAAPAPADRRDWRVVKEVFVAETDEEARRYALDGNLGRYFREFNLPLFRDWGFLHLHKDDLDEPDSVVDLDYLCERWLVGSVETVTRKLTELSEQLGGFGTLLVLGMDYAGHPRPWFQSMRLLAEEVAPNVSGLPVAS